MSETKGENQHEMERWHNPQSRDGGKCLAENAYRKRQQNNVHHKGKKTKHAVLCHCVSSQVVSSQVTLAAPRLGPEEGVGRTTNKTNTNNLQSRASVYRPDYPDHGPVLSGGVGGTEEKQTYEKIETNQGPARSQGSVGQEKKRTNQATQPNHARDAPNPAIKVPKHLKEPKEKDEDLKTQKAPGTTQRENADPNTQKRPGET